MISDTGTVKFGRYGGLYVPETLVQPLLELAEAYDRLMKNDEFRTELNNLLKNFAGRPTSSLFCSKSEQGAWSKDLPEAGRSGAWRSA